MKISSFFFVTYFSYCRIRGMEKFMKIFKIPYQYAVIVIIMLIVNFNLVEKPLSMNQLNEIFIIVGLFNIMVILEKKL